MTKTLTVLALTLALTATSAAQTVERTIDLSSLGWGRIEATPVDTDANPATEEWLIRGVDAYIHDPEAFTNRGLFRVVAVRHGGLCVGHWFNPRPSPLHGVTVVTLGGVSKLLLSTVFGSFGGDPENSNTLVIVALHTPPC